MPKKLDEEASNLRMSDKMRTEHRDTQARAELSTLIRKLTFIRSLHRAPLPRELDSVQASLDRLQKLVSD